MILIRHRFVESGIYGELFDDNEVFLAVTLEHSYNNKPKLISGEYVCRRGVHRLHTNPAPFETFEIEGVPGHDNILFHVGNFNKDSDGCVLLGEDFGEEMIVRSRAAFSAFMLKLADKSEFRLVVKNELPD